MREGQPRLRDEEIIQEDILLPVSFQCFACGLQLDSHGEMHVGDLGGQFTKEWSLDPADYHSIGMEDFGGFDEYGND